MRLEHAVIDVAASLTGPADRFRVLADTVQPRRTTTDALIAALVAALVAALGTRRRVRTERFCSTCPTI